MSSIGYSLISNIDLILAGMFEDQNKAVKDINKKQEAFAALIYEDLRKAYDAYMPNMHVLDADKAATIIVDGIISSPETVLSISDISYVPFVKDALIKAAPSLRKDIREGISALHNKFSLRVSGNPVRLLNAKLALYFRKLLRSSDGVITNEIYLKLGSYFNNLINETFPKNTALLGISAESVGIIPRPHRYVFFQKSFLSGKDTINQNITSVLKASLEKVTDALVYSNILPAKSVVGNFIDFGHAGARVDKESKILINTPALVKIIFNVTNLSVEEIKVSRRDVIKARDIFINKTGHIKQSIEVTKKFSVRTGMLFSIGMTTTTEMESWFNRAVLGKAESRQLDRSTQDRLNSTEMVRKSLFSRLSDTFLGPHIDKLIKGRSSPSILDYITEATIASLKGLSIPDYSQKLVKSKRKSYTQKIVSGSLPLPKVSSARQPKSQKPSANSYNSRMIGISVSSLTGLVALINANLAQKIKENMGDGSRKDILNLRSGRLAESAKVERLSESRAGMITAFYTYMKNPYATFSDGGRQQYPKSRDPKLLISKSIREIAAAQVNNRLRAVLV